MTKRKYTILSVSDKEKMFLEYKEGILLKSEIARKWGVNKSVLDRLVKKYNANISFESFTGQKAKHPGRPKEKFDSIEDELEFRRMVMAIEGKLRTLKELKNQINSD